jgi:hypothetical protein
VTALACYVLITGNCVTDRVELAISPARLGKYSCDCHAFSVTISKGVEITSRVPIQPADSLQFSPQGFVQPVRLCTVHKALYSPQGSVQHCLQARLSIENNLSI